jgi:hypothetical protein
MTPGEYLDQIKNTLILSQVVLSIDIQEEYALTDRGYFRARLILRNGDFLEVAEYFVLEHQQCVTKRYRYQWMDQTRQQLKKRWDNVPHFPTLANFPHHIHVEDEKHVEPGKPVSIVELIAILDVEVEKI